MLRVQIVKDQMGREVKVPVTPHRIVSLVPSQTELLCDLGLTDRLVGVTKFCIHPANIRKEKVVTGGTKKFRFDVIDKLKPDLIIGNKEENYQEGILQLSQEYPVWMSDIYNLEDALDMMEQLAGICHVETEGVEMISKIRRDVDTLPAFEPMTALYLIWRRPYMAVGEDTFINEVMKMAGFQNVIRASRYPELTETEILELNPDVILLSSEPYPFAARHQKELEGILPGIRVALVDGELFSWYGSRLLKLSKYLKSLRAELKK